MVLRSATISDLKEVAFWIGTAHECERWAGWRVPFPIDSDALPDAIGFEETNAFALVDGPQLVGFGQLVRKESGRGHLARLIVNPGLRGKGYGEALVRKLLEPVRTAPFERISLNVDRSNLPAVSVYLKAGFRDATRPPDEPESRGSRYMELQKTLLRKVVAPPAPPLQ